MFYLGMFSIRISAVTAAVLEIWCKYEDGTSVTLRPLTFEFILIHMSRYHSVLHSSDIEGVLNHKRIKIHGQDSILRIPIGQETVHIIQSMKFIIVSITVCYGHLGDLSTKLRVFLLAENCISLSAYIECSGLMLIGHWLTWVIKTHNGAQQKLLSYSMA
jgi:hypothetical protein